MKDIVEFSKSEIAMYIPELYLLDKSELGNDLILQVVGSFLPPVNFLNNMSTSYKVNILKKRVEQLEHLVLGVLDIVDVTNFFSHYNILKKFLESSEVLNPKLQNSIVNYLEKNQDDEYFNEVVNWLIVTPTYQINKTMDTEFFIAFEREEYYISAEVTDIETNVLKNLGTFETSHATYGGGNLKHIKITNFGLSIYYNLLNLIPSKYIDDIDIFMERYFKCKELLKSISIQERNSLFESYYDELIGMKNFYDSGGKIDDNNENKRLFRMRDICIKILNSIEVDEDYCVYDFISDEEEAEFHKKLNDEYKEYFGKDF